MWGVWKSKKQPSHYMLMDHTNFNAQLKLGTTHSQHGSKWVEMGQNESKWKLHFAATCDPALPNISTTIWQAVPITQCADGKMCFGLKHETSQTTGDFMLIQKNNSHRIRMTLILWYSECNARQMCWLAI